MHMKVCELIIFNNLVYIIIMLKIYHTYKKKLLLFKPIKKGIVHIYNCGPTVYYFPQIGNFRTFVFYDLLRRTFEYLGFQVKQVMNITDVGHLTMTETQKKILELKGEIIEITDTEDGIDRMQKAAKREGLSVYEIAQKYTEAIFGKDYKSSKSFLKDCDMGRLNILKPDILAKASDHIKEQIEIIKILEKKGFTYTTKQAVYFDIQKFPKYEELVGQKFKDMECTDRACKSDPLRKHPADFRLWQLDQPKHEMQWDSPWGRGFPGWHIECSAMSTKYLGQPFDIHTGGEDHIKVHHTAEMAQSESAYGKTMANYWMHGYFLTVDERRMGKSLGNAFIASDIENYSFVDSNGNKIDNKGELNLNFIALRYFYLTAHYRSKMDFTWKNYESARICLEKIINKIKEFKKSNQGKVVNSFKDEFIKAIEDDLNMPKALCVFWNVIKSDLDEGDKLATILDFDKVLGLNFKGLLHIKSEFDKETLEKINKLIKERKEARKDENWEKADEIREELRKMGVKVKDTEGGTLW
jgi:cysteinyl-tRNA synthetase